MSKAFDVPIDSTETYTFTIKYPVNILSGYTTINSNQKGDTLRIELGLNTTLGVLLNPVLPTDSTFITSQSVFDNLWLGHKVRLTDGVNTTESYDVIALNKETGEVTLDGEFGYSFDPSTPTFVQFTLLSNDIEFGEVGFYPSAFTKTSTSYVPANTPITITYQNKSLTEAKRPVIIFEYLY